MWSDSFIYSDDKDTAMNIKYKVTLSWYSSSLDEFGGMLYKQNLALYYKKQLNCFIILGKLLWLELQNG